MEHLGEELKQYGTRVLLTYGEDPSKIGLYDKVMDELKRQGLLFLNFPALSQSPHSPSIRARIYAKGKILTCFLPSEAVPPSTAQGNFRRRIFTTEIAGIW